MVPEIKEEGPETGEAELRVDVLLDYIKHEVVPTAGGPEGDGEEGGGVPAGVEKEEGGGGEDGQEEEEPAFEEDGACAGEVVG